MPEDAVRSEGDGFEKKSVYASLFNYGKSELVWLKIDPKLCGDGIGEVEPIPALQSGITNLGCYGYTICKGKVYFMGGRDLETEVPSKKAFCFDLVTKEWTDISDMNAARAYPVAVTVGEDIYVFGSKVEKDIPLNQWVEIYNHRSKQWGFLPNVDAPRDIVDIASINSVAVDEPNHQILLWVSPPVGVCSYNYTTNSWSRFHFSINRTVPISCYGVAVVHNHLLWHFFGSIYAYNLSDYRLFHLHRINDSLLGSRFGTPRSGDDPPLPSHLVRVAEDTLLFVYWNPISYHLEKNVNHMHCYKFRIKSSSKQEGCPFSLVCDGSLAYDSPGCDGVSDLLLG
ncbi:hypothetical protein ACHQM5_024743 [Ranunculus cassubicifolius]